MMPREEKTPGLVVHRWLTYVITLLLTLSSFLLVRVFNQVDNMQDDVQSIKVTLEHGKDVEAKVNYMFPVVNNHETRLTLLEAYREAAENKN